MKSDALGKTYARSVYQLASEEGVALAEELVLMVKAIERHQLLADILYTDTFTAQERGAVVKDLADRLKLSSLLKRFLLFLLQEKRLALFPTIWREIIFLDDCQKNRVRGIVEGSGDSIDESSLKTIQIFLESSLDKRILLKYRRAELTVGFRITVGDYHIDASVDHQLNRFKNYALG